MEQTSCISDLWRRGIALTTVIAILYSQVLPAYAMQGGSSDEEEEPVAPKRAKSSPSGRSKHDNNLDSILEDYAEHLYKASNQEEADAILENIPPHNREEVFKRVDQRNRTTGSSSSSASFSLNAKAPKGIGPRASRNEDDFPSKGEVIPFSRKLKGKQKVTSVYKYSKHPPFSLLEEEAEDLAGKIRAVVEAKGGTPYPPFKFKQTLSLLLPTLPEGNLKKGLKQLLSRIILPHEYWIDHESSFSVSHPLLKKAIDENHSSLKPLCLFIEDINAYLTEFFKGSLSKSKMTTNSISALLQETRTYYQGFIQDFCISSLHDKQVTLSNKALLCSPTLGYYLIPQAQARNLLFLDLYGQTISSTKSNQGEGNNAVTAEGGVHFKTHTSIGNNQIAMEGAMHAFMTLFMGQGLTPSTCLFVENVITNSLPDIHDIKDEEEKETVRTANLSFQQEVVRGKMSREDFFAKNSNWRRYYDKKITHSELIQASRTAGEISLYEFLEDVKEKKKEWQDLDLKSYSSHILFSLLTIPMDAKDDNLRVTPITKEGKTKWQIVGIDNDKALGSLIVKLGQTENSNTRHLIGGKNILFLLSPFMEEALDDEIYTRFVALNPYTFILDWLKAVQDQSQQYLSLAIKYPQKHREAFPLKFYPGMGRQVLGRLIKLQGYLKENKGASHHKILSHLSPLAAAYYEALREKDPDDPHFLQHVYLYGLDASVVRDLLKRKDQRDQLTPLESKVISLIEEKTAKTSLEAVIEELGEHSLESLLQGRRELHEDLEKETAGRGEYEVKRTSSIEDEIQLVVETLPSLSLSWRERLDVMERFVNYWPQDPLPFEAFESAPEGEAGNKTDHNPHQTLLYRVIEASFPEDAKVKVVTSLLNQALKKEKEGSIETSLSSLLNQKNNSGKTYLDLAVQKNSSALFERLVFYGAEEVVDYPEVELFYVTHKGNPFMQESFQTLFTKNPSFQGIVLRNHFFVTAPSHRGSVPIYLSGYKNPFYLPHVLWSQLFDQKGQFKQINTSGRREIGLLEKGKYGLFFKKYPAFPGLEQGVRRLAYGLFQDNMGYTVLAKINEEPYLLSLGVGRDPKVTPSSLQDRLNPYKEANFSYVLERSPERLKDIAPESLSKTILMAMLVNQEDGKPNNFAMERMLKGGKYSLISFDNDQAFGPEVMKAEGKGKACPQVKSILFCLNEMENPLHKKAVKRLAQVDVDGLFKEWLEEMQVIHEADQGLFKPRQIQSFWDKKEGLWRERKECYVGVPFMRRQEGQTEGIGYLYGTLALMQRCVREDPVVSGGELLKAVHPFVAHRYGQGLLECSQKSVGEKFKHIDGIYYRGGTTLTTSGLMVEAWGVASHQFIKEAEKEGKVVMPKTALKDLEALREKRKTTELGILTSRGKNSGAIRALLQRKAVESISLDLRGYTDYQAEWLFQELKKQRALQSLSLKGSSINDNFWNFSECPLKEIHFFRCKNLTNTIFLLLSSHCPLIEKLSVTSSPLITAVESSYSLFSTSEPLLFSSLYFLNLSKNRQLQRLQLKAPRLAHLFLSGCLKLKAVDLIEGANTLETLDIKATSHFYEDELQKVWSQHTTLKSIKTQGCNLVYPEMLEVLYPYSLDLREIIMRAYGRNSNLREIFGLENARVRDDKMQPLPSLTQLISLDLGGNNIRDNGAHALSPLTQLTSLDLGDNNIRDNGAHALSPLTQLTSLNLGGNNIGADGARALSFLIQLTSLNLRQNGIGRDGAHALSPLTQLTSLDLGGNNIRDNGAHALSSLIQLTSLNLRDNKIKEAGADTLPLLTQLTSLNLQENEIGDKDVRALSPLTQLTSLNLGDNKIKEAGAHALSSLIQLTSLNLGGNNIKEAGARALSPLTQLTSLNVESNYIEEAGVQALSSLTQLTSLDLGRNNIKDDGADALSPLTQLTSLNLWSNKIRDNGARALSPLTQLTSLNLQWNKIRDNGARALSPLLQLTSLKLRWNNIEDGGARALSPLTQLTSLDLRGNNIKSQETKWFLRKKLPRTQIDF